MTESSADLDIPKYTGSADDGPVQDWFNLFELHATAASWSEREMVTNFSDYVTGEAFKFYLIHIFENDESWQKIREEMIARFNDYDKDFLITGHLHTTTRDRHSPRLFLKERSFPPGFPSRKPVFSKSSLQHTTRDVAYPPHALHFSSRIRGPPPGFSSRGSSSAPKAHHLPHKDALLMVDQLTHEENTEQRHDYSKSENPGFTSLRSFVAHNAHFASHTPTTVGIELRNSEYTEPSLGPTVSIHTSEQLTSTESDTEKQPQVKSDPTKPLAASPSSSQQSGSPTNTGGSEGSTPKLCPVPGTPIKNGVATASGDFSANSGALSSLLDSNRDTLTSINYLLVTSTYKEKRARGSKGSSPRQTVQHQQCQQKQQEEPQQLKRPRQHRLRTTKTASQEYLQPEDCRDQHTLKKRLISHLSYLRRKKSQGTFLQQHSRLRLRSEHLRHHHRKLPKSHKTTACALQEHKQRLISHDQRARKLHARRLYDPRQKMRRLRNIQSCKAFQPRSFFARIPAVLPSVSMSKAFLCYPERNHQPRPPELLR